MMVGHGSMANFKEEGRSHVCMHVKSQAATVILVKNPVVIGAATGLAIYTIGVMMT